MSPLVSLTIVHWPSDQGTCRRLAPQEYVFLPLLWVLISLTWIVERFERRRQRIKDEQYRPDQAVFSAIALGKKRWAIRRHRASCDASRGQMVPCWSLAYLICDTFFTLLCSIVVAVLAARPARLDYEPVVKFRFTELAVIRRIGSVTAA